MDVSDLTIEIFKIGGEFCFEDLWEKGANSGMDEGEPESKRSRRRLVKWSFSPVGAPRPPAPHGTAQGLAHGAAQGAAHTADPVSPRTRRIECAAREQTLHALRGAPGLADFWSAPCTSRAVGGVAERPADAPSTLASLHIETPTSTRVHDEDTSLDIPSSTLDYIVAADADAARGSEGGTRSQPPVSGDNASPKDTHACASKPAVDERRAANSVDAALDDVLDGFDDFGDLEDVCFGRGGDRQPAAGAPPDAALRVHWTALLIADVQRAPNSVRLSVFVQGLKSGGDTHTTLKKDSGLQKLDDGPRHGLSGDGIKRPVGDDAKKLSLDNHRQRTLVLRGPWAECDYAVGGRVHIVDALPCAAHALPPAWSVLELDRASATLDGRILKDDIIGVNGCASDTANDRILKKGDIIGEKGCASATLDGRILKEGDIIGEKGCVSATADGRIPKNGINDGGHLHSHAPCAFPAVRDAQAPLLVVYAPEVLISATAVADAIACVRRGVLSHHFAVPADENPPTAALVAGSAAHDVFEHVIAGPTPADAAAVERAVGRAVRAHLADAYAAGMPDEGAVAAAVSGILHGLPRWCATFLRAEPLAAASHPRGELPVDAQSLPITAVGPQRVPQGHVHPPTVPHGHVHPKTVPQGRPEDAGECSSVWLPVDAALCVPSVCSLEDMHSSAVLGLKGKMDAVVLARWRTSADGPHSKGTGGTCTQVVPLELKTGRASVSTEHRAQTLLYTLLIGERLCVPVQLGLLFYAAENALLRVFPRPGELADLLGVRNRMAAACLAFRAPAPRGPGGRWVLPALPPLVTNRGVCRTCPQASNCALLERVSRDQESDALSPETTDGLSRENESKNASKETKVSPDDLDFPSDIDLGDLSGADSDHAAPCVRDINAPIGAPFDLQKLANDPSGKQKLVNAPLKTQKLANDPSGKRTLSNDSTMAQKLANDPSEAQMPASSSAVGERLSPAEFVAKWLRLVAMEEAVVLAERDAPFRPGCGADVTLLGVVDTSDGSKQPGEAFRFEAVFALPASIDLVPGDPVVVSRPEVPAERADVAIGFVRAVAADTVRVACDRDLSAVLAAPMHVRDAPGHQVFARTHVPLARYRLRRDELVSAFSALRTNVLQLLAPAAARLARSVMRGLDGPVSPPGAECRPYDVGPASVGTHTVHAEGRTSIGATPARVHHVGRIAVTPTLSSPARAPTTTDHRTISRGDIVHGDIVRGDIHRGDIGRGDIVRGDIVRGDIGRGDIGRGDIDHGAVDHRAVDYRDVDQKTVDHRTVDHGAVDLKSAVPSYVHQKAVPYSAVDLKSVDTGRAGMPNDTSGCTNEESSASLVSRFAMHLDDDQRAALEHCLGATDGALVLGMPGTGKSTTLVALIRALVLGRGARVLVSAYTHSAVDNLLAKLLAAEPHDALPSILRIGSAERTHEAVRPALLANARSIAEIRARVRGARVVGVTCLAANAPALLCNRGEDDGAPPFDYAIVDEASQATLPAVLGPLRLARRFVLCGDHMQLPPLVRDAGAAAAGLATSLFEALAMSSPAAVATLATQYRMNRAVMAVANATVYDGLLRCGSDAVRDALLVPPRQPAGAQPWLRAALEPGAAVVFLDTDALPGARETPSALSFYNNGEARVVGAFVSALVGCGVPPASLCVIAAYKPQVALISEMLAASLGDTSASQRRHLASEPIDQRQTRNAQPTDLEVSTVDRFQGRDKDCVVLSLVRSNPAGAIGALISDWRRLNVAFTRARRKLVIVGSWGTIMTHTAMEPLARHFANGELQALGAAPVRISLPPDALSRPGDAS